MLQGLRVSHKTATWKFIFCSSCCWVFVSDTSNFARDKRRTLLLFLHFLHVALTACYMYLFAGYVKVNRPKFIYQNHPSLMPRLVRKSQELNILEHQQCQYDMSWFSCEVTSPQNPLNPFTPKSDQLQFSLSVSHQRYIIQYGEFGNR